jgi:hypothetical protein
MKKAAPKKKKQRLTREKREAFVQAAQRQYSDEGTLEIDDEALVSWTSPEEGGSGGAYVQAWVWVSDED